MSRKLTLPRCGDWSVDVLECGRLSLDGGSMFGSVPRTLWERRITPDARHRIPLAMRLLLLRNESSGATVLVDTGIGDKFDDEFGDIFAVEWPESNGTESPVESALATSGLRPEDISDLVLTHLHFDHGGGATCLVDGRLSPTFPGAKHWLQRSQWDTARQPNLREKASYLSENIEPLANTELELLDGPAEILPGLSVERSDGHTMGMQTLRIEGGGRVIRFVSDLSPTAHHVHLPFTMGYDLCPRSILVEKEAAWTAALDEEAILVFQHDPVTVAGTVYVDRGKFRARPWSGELEG